MTVGDSRGLALYLITEQDRMICISSGSACGGDYGGEEFSFGRCSYYAYAESDRPTLTNPSKSHEIRSYLKELDFSAKSQYNFIVPIIKKLALNPDEEFKGAGADFANELKAFAKKEKFQFNEAVKIFVMEYGWGNSEWSEGARVPNHWRAGLSVEKAMQEYSTDRFSYEFFVESLKEGNKDNINYNNSSYTTISEYGIFTPKSETHTFVRKFAFKDEDMGYYSSLGQVHSDFQKRLRRMRFPAVLDDGSQRLYKELSLTEQETAKNVFLSKVTVENGVLTEYFGCDEYVEIPPGLITELGVGCFRESLGLKRVTLPLGVKKIGDHAFADCSFLKKVEVQNDLTYIGTGAFVNCDALELFDMPDSVTEVGESVFEFCKKLQTVQLSKSLKKLTCHMFAGCWELSELLIPEGVTEISSGVFAFCDALEEIVIPNSVVKIDRSAFQSEKYYDRNEMKIIFKNPVGWKAQGEGDSLAFSEAEMNNSEVFKNEINRWGGIERCEGKKAVELPARADKIPEKYFEGCIDLEEYVVPSTVKEIGDRAFATCAQLKKIVLPDTLEKIGVLAFADCRKLEEIHIPKSVKEIGGGCFRGCVSLKQIELPEGVSCIPEALCYECAQLEEVVMPSGIKAINAYAFGGCERLKAIQIPASVEVIEQSAFNECSSLERIEIPIGVKAVNKSAFEKCTALTDVLLHDGIEKIGDAAFLGCDKLQKIILPDTVVAIGDRAFQGCKELWNAVLPKSLQELNAWVFGGCEKLCEIAIPCTVKKIESYAFCDCKNLSAVILPNEIEELSDTAFTNCGLTEITIPGTIKHVSRTFSGCKRLEKAIFEEGIESIGSYAFKDCKNIREIVFPRSLRTIENCAFSGCNALTSVIFPEGLERIELLAFERCKNLREVYVPTSVQIIHSRAFEGCDQLNPKPTAHLPEGRQRHVTVKVKFPDGRSYKYNCDYPIKVGDRVKVGGKRADSVGEVVAIEGDWSNNSYMVCVAEVIK